MAKKEISRTQQYVGSQLMTVVTYDDGTQDYLPAGTTATSSPVIPMATWIITALQQIPELNSLYQKVKNPDGSFKYDAATIATMINDTDWYRLNGPTVAQKLIDRIKGGENAYREGVNEYRQSVSKTATELGLDATDPMVSNYLAALGENAYLHNWTPAQVEGVITSNTEIVKKIKGGLYSAQASDIADFANTMGTVVSAGDMTNYTQRLMGLTDKNGVRVRSSVDDIKAEIRKNTATKYGVFADQINAGVSLWDLTSNYRQKAADLLEVDPDTIKWDDPLFKDGKIFQSVDPKDPSKIVARPLWEADKMIRGDERWQYTKNANDQYDKYAYSILQKFGMVA
jgi:hypothetical protein